MELTCYGCVVGFHEECINPKPLADSMAGYYKCCCWETPDVLAMAEPTVIFPEERRRTPKAAEEIRDQTSTGRKRAVVAMEEWGRGKDGTLCEWSYLRNAGGGTIPIVGCNGTIIRIVKRTENLPEGESPRHVHHGPDKSTLNNTELNLHAICASCHGRWHALNDPHYGERPEHGQAFVPVGEMMQHDPLSRANDKEMEFSDKFWSLTAAQRKVIQFRLVLETLGSLDEQLTGP